MPLVRANRLARAETGLSLDMGDGLGHIVLMSTFRFPTVPTSPEERALRRDVRAFLAAERAAGGFAPRADCWVSAASPAFSAKLGARGWLGMTWPTEYGGHARPPLHRLIVTEELLAAGAPVAAHWIADRQTGPQILRFGTEDQRRTLLPRMAAGTCFAAIGMSEPQAGSDLAAVQTRAEKTATGWRLSGRKIWSTGAHFSDLMIVLARTSPPEGRNRQVGLSQFLVPLNLPGVNISGIRDLAGSVHFNETLFEDVALPADALLGQEGNGWAQCMGELAIERSGPERYLTTFAIFEQALDALRTRLDDSGAAIVGRLAAHLAALRHMSRGISKLIEDGTPADTEAALVKQMGNAFEKDVIADMRRLLVALPRHEWPAGLQTLLDDAILRLPSNTLRGGTTEILHGIIARQLGMR